MEEGQMKGLLKLVLVTALLCSMSSVAKGEEEAVQEKPLVQIAVLLDTSNSMDGLIDQAKAQLWSIVSEFALAKKNGETPDLRVALFEYGNDGLSAGEGHIRMVSALTNDLDKISEELFALTTNGGSEYCGWVISDAVEDLDWSESTDVYKAIFIAGNEPFTQGKVNYKQACEKAIEKGIIVNTIHCGPERQGINGRWKDGADLADGSFMIIDQNRRVVHIDAPQDEKIAELNKNLNDTYVPYGAKGVEGKEKQEEQDANAAKYGGGNVSQRVFSKANTVYRNDAWDLVDAVNNDKVVLEEVEEKDLPENMQKMTKEEREEYVKSQYEKRQNIQLKIKELSAERNKYVAEKQKELAEDDDTLGGNITKTVRDQASKQDFVFEKD
jgi:hypothetical protein